MYQLKVRQYNEALLISEFASMHLMICLQDLWVRFCHTMNALVCRILKEYELAGVAQVEDALKKALYFPLPFWTHARVAFTKMEEIDILLPVPVALQGNNEFKLMSKLSKDAFVFVLGRSMLPVWFQWDKPRWIVEKLKAHISLQAFVYSFNSACKRKWVLSFSVAGDSSPFVVDNFLNYWGFMGGI